MNVSDEDCLRDCEQYISTHSTLPPRCLHASLSTPMMTNLFREHLWHLSLNCSLVRRHSTSSQGCHRAALRVPTGEPGDVPSAILSEARASEYHFDYAEIFSAQPSSVIERSSISVRDTVVHRRTDVIVQLANWMRS